MNQNTAVASMSLKIVGVILILSSLLDYVLLAYPVRLDTAWQLAYTTQIVERGIIPLVGIAFLVTGYWIDNSEGVGPSRRNPVQDLRFWAFLLSTVLGIVFLLLFPLHLNNVRIQRGERLQEVRTQATQAESQVVNQLQNEGVETEIEQRRSEIGNQIKQLLSDEERLNQALASPSVPQREKELLEQFKDNPEAVNEFLNQQFSTEALRNQQLTRIRSRRQELEEQAKVVSTKAALQTGISSLLLAIAYSAIGWSGLKNLGIRGGRRKPSAR